MAFDPLGIVRALNEDRGLENAERLAGALRVLNATASQPTIAALRTMKREAGRDKDRVDLAELEALHGDG